MAAAALPPSGRKVAFRFVDAALVRPGFLPEGLEARRLYQGVPGLRPYPPGARAPAAGWSAGDEWRGVAPALAAWHDVVAGRPSMRATAPAETPQSWWPVA